jgi:acetyl/propionyl-CoA carboxylase alpha subunit
MNRTTTVFVALIAAAGLSTMVYVSILQAMKMDNQIKSPRSGRIKETKVSKNQSVKEGDILVTFE